MCTSDTRTREIQYKKRVGRFIQRKHFSRFRQPLQEEKTHS